LPIIYLWLAAAPATALLTCMDNILDLRDIPRFFSVLLTSRLL
jgi:hypothetical protein